MKSSSGSTRANVSKNDSHIEMMRNIADIVNKNEMKKMMETIIKMNNDVIELEEKYGRKAETSIREYKKEYG